jgi:hypothetical protein
MAQGTTRGIPIDTDVTLSADSDMLVASQKAVKTYADTKISSIIGTSPIVSSGGTTPSISIPLADGHTDGYLSASDFTTFSGKGIGDMVLSSIQTNSGTKTFLNTTFLLRNVANTFNGSFTNTNTADRVYTLPNAAGTIALTSDLTSYVPYTGAASNVNLGANSLFTSILGVGISSSLSATAHVRGTSASVGSSFLVQNSTPVNLFNVLNNGFVGIGSNTPVSLLHIGTGASTTLGDFNTPVITFNSVNNGIYLDSNKLFFKAAGAFNFGIDSTGVLGTQFRINGGSNNLTTPVFVPHRLTPAGLASGFGGNSVGDICLITNSTTRLRINTNGDLGFFGVTPVARQTLGEGTAGATYGTNEQGMLQRVYTAIRNYGLGT